MCAEGNTNIHSCLQPAQRDGCWGSAVWLPKPGSTLRPTSPNALFYTYAPAMQILRQTGGRFFIIFLISSERSQAVVNPSSFLVTCSFWISFTMKRWCLSPAWCVALGMEGSSRATPAPGQPLGRPQLLVRGHRPWPCGGRRYSLCNIFFFRALVIDSDFSSW